MTRIVGSMISTSIRFLAERLHLTLVDATHEGPQDDDLNQINAWTQRFAFAA